MHSHWAFGPALAMIPPVARIVMSLVLAVLLEMLGQLAGLGPLGGPAWNLFGRDLELIALLHLPELTVFGCAGSWVTEREHFGKVVV